MTDDPCLRCVLPDCNEESPRCLLRKAANDAARARRNGCDLTEAEQRVAKMWAKRNDVEFYARRSETV